jgi:hypothetical protein
VLGHDLHGDFGDLVSVDVSGHSPTLENRRE